jgi:membrane-associated protein
MTSGLGILFSTLYSNGMVCQTEVRPVRCAVPVFALNVLDPHQLLETFGTLGLFAVVFAESGLLIGFFLPGDSLLFTAGLLASQGKLNLAVILAGCFVAAVAGDQVGYQIGKRMGPALFRRPDSRLFKRDHVDRAQAYFDRHGSKTIVLARFVPVVRTFAPIVAGVGEMRYRTFATFNVLGGFLWAIGVTLLGFILGETIPSIDRYLLPAIVVIVVVSALPVAIELLRARKAHSGGNSPG